MHDLDADTYNDPGNARKVVVELLESAGELMLKDRITPGLALCMVAIDTLSWLGRPEAEQDGSKREFVSWVNQFMLPNSSLPCTALEIYAARCGILHSQSPKSGLSKQGKARQIFWVYGNADPAVLEAAVANSKEAGKVVIVQLVDFLRALQNAAMFFGQHLMLNRAFSQVVARRGKEMLSSFPSNEPPRRSA